MTARRATSVPMLGLAGVLALSLLPQAALAEGGQPDPLSGWERVGDGALAGLSGREGVAVPIDNVIQHGQQDFSISQDGNTVDAQEMQSGKINFNESLGNMHGIFNQLNNTGIGANNQNGLVVNINVF